MFRWYQDAESCSAFLSDVCVSSDSSVDDIRPAWMESFYSSKWFTRGWTLQELLAPDNFTFSDGNWRELGTKESLKEHATTITGINDIFNFDKASIAQRFSWASKRQTTRVEDAAYCLMGLFGVNMALLHVSTMCRLNRFLLSIVEISS